MLAREREEVEMDWLGDRGGEEVTNRWVMSLISS
jgi:hypothetical protein